MFNVGESLPYGADNKMDTSETPTETSSSQKKASFSLENYILKDEHERKVRDIDDEARRAKDEQNSRWQMTFNSEKANSENVIKQLQNRLLKTDHELEEKKILITELAEENAKRAVDVETSWQSIKQLKEENARKSEELNNFREWSTKLEKDLKIKEEELKKFNKKSSKDRDELKAKTQKQETEIKGLHAKCTNLEKELENSRKQCAELKAINSTIVNKDREIVKLQRTCDSQQNAKEHLGKEVAYFKEKCSNLTDVNHALDQEKQSLLLRLSKVAGANLMYNNPNIADLGDQNRPTKLAETFSELYDNEWTDAFDDLKKKDDKEKIEAMLQILQNADNLCRQTSLQHADEIKDSITTLRVRLPPVSVTDASQHKTDGKHTGTEDLDTNRTLTAKHDRVDNEDNIKDTDLLPTASPKERKHNPKDTEKEGSVTMSTPLVEFKHKLHGDELNSKQTCSGVTKEIKPNAGEDKIIHQQRSNTSSEAVNQEHNATVATLGQNKHGGTMDRTTDPTEESKSITMDFVVVSNSGDVDTEDKTTNVQKQFNAGVHANPDKHITAYKQTSVEHNHDTAEKIKAEASNQIDGNKKDPNGQPEMVIVKNIVYGFDNLQNTQKVALRDMRKQVQRALAEDATTVISEVIFNQLQLEEGNFDNLQAYVKKCVTTCWAMCQHDPPVYIKFVEVKEETPFDTTIYKSYTRTGKLVDFIVWPAVFLHKDGPLLGKGVAQAQTKSAKNILLL